MILFSVIALEKFAQTSENKVKFQIIELLVSFNSLSLLEHLVKLLNSKLTIVLLGKLFFTSGCISECLS